MRKGRPTLSDKVKKQKGTLKKSRVNKAAPRPPAILKIPSPPALLGVEGKKEWKKQVDLLDRMGILSSTDLGALTALCKEWENYVDMEKTLKKTKRFYQVNDPKTKQLRYVGIHPAHTIAQQHLKSYIGLCNEFGFTPAARSKISLPTKEKASKAAGLLKKAI